MRFTAGNQRTAFVADLDGAESRLQMLGEPRRHWMRRRGRGTADLGAGVVGHGMGEGYRRKQRGHDGEDSERSTHGLLPNAGFPVVKLLAKSGRPIELGKISSRKKCTWPMTPTLVPLSRLIGIMASSAS